LKFHRAFYPTVLKKCAAYDAAQNRIKTVKITEKEFDMKFLLHILAALGVTLILCSTSLAQDNSLSAYIESAAHDSQQDVSSVANAWQGDIDRAASNTDTEASLGCPADYASNQRGLVCQDWIGLDNY
jgi:hypothetical protein